MSEDYSFKDNVSRKQLTLKSGHGLRLVAEATEDGIQFSTYDDLNGGTKLCTVAIEDAKDSDGIRDELCDFAKWILKACDY